MSEYGLIIALVVVLLIASVGVIGAGFGGVFNGVVSSINSAVGNVGGGGGGPNPSSPAGGVVILSDQHPTADQTIVLTGTGFTPNSLVIAHLHPDPATVIGTGHADSSGNITVSALLPAGISLTTHTITLDGTAGSPAAAYNEVSSDFPVVASPVHLSAGNGSPLYSGNYSLATYGFTSTVSGNVGPISYAWTGPGGFASANANPAASLLCSVLPGTVSLVVTDGSGHHGRASLPLDTCPGALTLSVSAGSPTFAPDYSSLGLPVAATASGGSGTLGYAWTGAHLVAGSTDSAPTLDFTCSASASSVTATVTDVLGQSVSASATVPSCPGALASVISSTPLYSGNYSLNTVSLSDNASGGSGGPFTYAWSGPGGWTSTDATPAPTFACSALPGTVSVIATDSAGHPVSDSKTIAACPSPISVSSAVGTATVSGNYTSQSVGLTGTIHGGTTPYNVAWTGTGTFTASGSASTAVSLTCSPSATTETITVTDANGQSDSATASVPPCGAPIDASINATPLYSGNYSLETISLSASVSGGSSGKTYAWSGPGSWTSSASAPSPTFACSALPGTIGLTVTDSTGQENVASLPLAACPDPIAASASAGSPSYVGNYASQTVALTGGATGGTGSYTFGWSGANSTFTPSASAQSPSLSLTCSTSATTETISVTDTNGQSDSATVSIAACPGGIGASVTGTPLYSGNYSLDTVSLSVSPSGGQAPYTYAWSGPSSWTSTDSAPAPSFACSALPGSASVIITDAAGHTTTSSASIAACPSPVNASAAGGSPSYSGNYASQSVALTGSASGGVAPRTFAWTGAGTFVDASSASTTVDLTCSASATTETLTATDVNGQSDSATATVPPCPSNINASVSGTPLYSGNYSLNTVSLSATTGGGQGALTYAWSGPGSWTSSATSPAPSFTCSELPGTVNLTVTDSAGHASGASLPIAACPSPINASASAGTATYVGNYASQTLALTGGASGGVGSYIYSWNGANSTFTPLATSQSPSLSLTCSAFATAETISATDANGQSDTATVSIPACPGNISASISGTPLYSGNYSLDTVSLSATTGGGQGSFTYAWSGPGSWTSTATTPAPSFTCSQLPSTVNLVITDTAGHTNGASLPIAACPDPMSASASAGSPSYANNYTSQSAALTGSASGGVSPLTYHWSGTGSFSPSANVASPTVSLSCSANPVGETFTATDANGQSVSADATIGACPGSMFASVTGSPLYSGNYSLDTVTLSASVGGGITPIAYAWSGPGGWSDSSANPTPSFACSALPGSIILTITDSAGVQQTGSTDISACPSPLSASASAGTPSYVGNYASATVALTGGATGGVSSYTWSWSGANSTFTPSSSTQSPSLSLTCSAFATTETLTVTDTNSQSNSATVSIPPCPSNINASVSGTPLYSGNYSLDTVSLSASTGGGQGGLTYAWSGPGSWTSSATSPAPSFACSALPGTVNLTVTDSSGHSNGASLPVAACPTPISVSATGGSSTYVGNYASQTLALTGGATGGVGSYTYSWSGANSTFTPSASSQSPSLSLICSSSATTETLAVTDTNGQTNNGTVSIAACPSNIGANVVGTPLYSGNYSLDTVSLSATPSGGQGPYTYAWSGPGSWTSSAATPAPTFNCSALPYTVTVSITDSTGHSGGSSVNVAACPSPLSGSASAGSPSYVGNYASATVALTGSASGGSGSYTYSWSGSNSTFSPSSANQSPSLSLTCSASATTETLTISDGSGQNYSPTVSIPACPTALSAAATKGSPTYTGNYTNVAYGLTATPTGGNGTKTYSWTGPAPLNGSTSATPSPNFACTALSSSPSATVTITDANGKTAQDSVTLPACPSPISAVASQGSPAYSGNYSLDTIIFGTVASGGSGTLTYSWSGPTGLSGSTIAAPAPSLACSVLTGSPSASVTVSDANGQSMISNSLTIAACPGVINVSAPSITSQTYDASYTNATIVLSSSASGGSGGLTYSWSTTASGSAWTGGTTTTPSLGIPALQIVPSASTKTITVTVTDGNQSASQTINIPTAPSACGP